MELKYYSDLHIEFPSNKAIVMEELASEKADMLVLAGDIVPFIDMDNHDDFFDMISKNFGKIYWVPGNHEYYYYDINEKGDIFSEQIRENVFLVNNITIIEHDVKFIFSTLWSKILPENEITIMNSLSDFRVIRNNGERFTPNKFNELHTNCLKFISDELKKNDAEKTVVVTHHVPTFVNYPKKYINSKINGAFTTELKDVIENSNINYWIFGHHHENVDDFKIGNTTMLTNQMGYVDYGEQKLFDKNRAIKV